MWNIVNRRMSIRLHTVDRILIMIETILIGKRHHLIMGMEVVSSTFSIVSIIEGLLLAPTMIEVPSFRLATISLSLRRAINRPSSLLLLVQVLDRTKR